MSEQVRIVCRFLTRQDRAGYVSWWQMTKLPPRRIQGSRRSPSAHFNFCFSGRSEIARYLCFFRARWRALLIALVTLLASTANSAATDKPVLHGRHWVAITGKPLGATAGAKDMARHIAKHMRVSRPEVTLRVRTCSVPTVLGEGASVPADGDRRPGHTRDARAAL